MSVALCSIRLVVCDWSGVISDDRRPVYEAYIRILEQYGKPKPSFEDWLSTAPPNAQIAFERAGIAEDPRFLARLYSDKLSEVGREGIRPVIYPTVLPFFKLTAGCGLMTAVVSTHPIEHLLREVREYGLYSLIAESAIVGDARDKPSEIKRFLRDTRTDMNSAVYIGDSIYDIRAGKQAGVCTVGITGGYHSRQSLRAEGPFLLVDSLLELGALLAAGNK